MIRCVIVTLEGHDALASSELKMARLYEFCYWREYSNWVLRLKRDEKNLLCADKGDTTYSKLKSTHICGAAWNLKVKR